MNNLYENEIMISCSKCGEIFSTFQIFIDLGDEGWDLCDSCYDEEED